jgi:hypothetical protein
MSPLADMINHSHMPNSTFHIVNKKLHLNQDNPSYFDPDKYLCDLSLVVGKTDILGFKPIPSSGTELELWQQEI